MENVGIRDQILAPVRLDRLVKQTLGSEMLPSSVIRSMKHLLRRVELLNVLRQPVFGRVDLATGIAYQWCCRCYVTVLSGEILFSQ